MGPLFEWANLSAGMFMLCFARVGTAMILLPGFGEMRIPGRFKIALSAMVSVAMVAALPFPAAPESPAALAALIALEAAVGAFFAVAIRAFFAAVHIVGGIVGYASGLSNALAPPDVALDNATAVSALLHMGLLTLVFVTDTHHLMIGGLMRSYALIPVGGVIMGDVTEQTARLGAGAFYIAVMVGGPFIIFAVLMNLALGLANRVMPTMQVFFVAGPGLIVAGFVLLALTAAAILNTTLDAMSGWLLSLRA